MKAMVETLSMHSDFEPLEIVMLVMGLSLIRSHVRLFERTALLASLVRAEHFFVLYHCAKGSQEQHRNAWSWHDYFAWPSRIISCGTLALLSAAQKQ